MLAHADTTGLSRRVRGLEEGIDTAALAVLLEGADAFVGFMEEFGRRDTGRYVRAWIEAGNGLGIPRRALPPLRASRWETKIRGALESQIERLVNRINTLQGMLDRWYHSRGRAPNAWYRVKQREINMLTRRLVTAVGTLREFQKAGDGPVIAFDVFSQGRTKVTRAGVRRRLRLTSVRTRVYGGEGRVMRRGDGETVVVLHNREPHVSLVERRYRLIARGRGYVRAYTDANAKRIATRELTAA